MLYKVLPVEMSEKITSKIDTNVVVPLTELVVVAIAVDVIDVLVLWVVSPVALVGEEVALLVCASWVVGAAVDSFVVLIIVSGSVVYSSCRVVVVFSVDSTEILSLNYSLNTLTNLSNQIPMEEDMKRLLFLFYSFSPNCD